jgi:hypothetical protein
MSINFDELVSLESEEARKAGNTKPPLSPVSPHTPYYSLVGLTVGQASPTGRSLSSDFSSSPKNQVHHGVNAVHMHIQENAKVPNLHQAIDRSNSSRPLYPKSFSSHDNGGQDSGAFSMAELFLKKESSHRRSLEQNYESLGSLLTDVELDGKRRRLDDNVKGDTKMVAVHDSQIEIDEWAAAVDPTPWSEIEKKIHNDEETAQGTTTSSVPPPGHAHHYNYYPYGRHHQLPIPEKPTLSHPNAPTTSGPVPNGKPSIPTMAQAVATAAAIAIASTETGAPRPRPTPPTAPPVTSSVQPPPYTKAQQTTPMGFSRHGSGSRHYQGQRATYSAPQHSVTHTTSRASVIAATNKKSQYGFGGNHTVPSVPAPPPVTNGTFTRTGATNPRTVPTMPSLPLGHIPPPNSGAAYERKKQRAKDARVKLNDAIERLSISISLAGSQSKQRNQFLSTRIATADDRAKTLQTSAECANLAEQAKKWDRPSFIGTAASMVLELNAQCEALTREVVSLQERSDTTKRHNSSSCDSLTSHPEHKRHEHPVSSVNAIGGNDPKRIRSNSVKGHDGVAVPRETSHAEATLDEKAIFGAVKNFLDPIAMCRCSCVSRRWTDIGAFDNDDAWLNLAVRRFGFYNVRQWTERLDDSAEDTVKSFSKKAVYRSMNAANVMPHFKQENVCLLGDAKISGRVSGWVFMVERSNGETLRSVKIEPGLPSPANGTYQSRPVVELRIIIQNTGMANQPVIIRNQQVSVDVSTRRTGGELKEISWDDRFSKGLKNLDGTVLEMPATQSKFDISSDLCHLKLFDAVMLEVYINARGCSTTSKFQQRSNFTKLLMCLDGTTVPMVIPFLRDHGSH